MDESYRQFQLALDIVRFNGMPSTDAIELSEYLMGTGYVHIDWLATNEQVTALREGIERLRQVTAEADAALDLTHEADPLAPILDEPDTALAVPLAKGHAQGPDTVPMTTAQGSARKREGRGTRYQSEWTDPSNTKMPKPGIEREWSGWRMNKRAIDTLLCFTGDRGRVVATPQWLAKHARYDKTSQKNGRERQKVYIRHVPNALVRKGLLEMVDKDLYQLTPRGRMYVINILQLEPTPKHVGVSTTE